MGSSRGSRASIAGVLVVAASLAFAGSAPASPEEEGVSPGAERPGDRSFGGIHTVPVRRGGLLDYGTLPDGSRLLSHGPDRGSTGRPTPPAPAGGPDGAGPLPESIVNCVPVGAPNSYEVIYYIAQGQPDNFDAKKLKMQLQVVRANQRMLAEALQEGLFYRAIRVESDSVPPLCLPRIQKINGNQAGVFFGAVVGDLSANFGKNRADRKYLVFVERPTGCGQGTIYRDETKGTANQHNVQTGYALIYGDPDGNGPGAPCWDSDGFTALHEMTHNLSGVQACVTWQGVLLTEGSPNNNTIGCVIAGGAERFHCTDETAQDPDGSDALGDVMCQLENNAEAPHQVCPLPITVYDCNHDDYFNPNPLAGSYLDRRFNLANDSLFVERLDVGPLPAR